jgi:hypothetical protein
MTVSVLVAPFRPGQSPGLTKKEHTMNGKAKSITTLGILAMTAIALVGCKSGIHVGGPSIEGTYQLTSRELPDGSRVEPPAIVGMLTYTDDHRNFNVSWTDANGKRTSVSSISEYELVDKRYWEQCTYYLVNDEIGGTGLKYDLTRPGGASVVTIGDNGVIAFDLPLFNEPSVVFTRSGMTATREGEFVDHWIKVD